MKWYIWATIAVALGVIGFFSWKMFIKKDDSSSTNAEDNSSANTKPIGGDVADVNSELTVVKSEAA